MNPAKRSSGSTNRAFTLGLALVALVAVSVMAPCVRNGFTNWDDDRFVLNNPVVHHLTWPRVGDIFTSFTVGTYVPLTQLSFALEYTWARLDPFFYHLTNVLLHMVNCLLVCWLFRRLTGNWKIALVTGLLWAVNPLRVESVAWITERKDMLSSFFYLGALIAYLAYRRGRRSHYWICLLLFAAALLAKPMAMSLPLLLLVIDLFQRRKPDRGLWLEKIPLGALAVAALVVNLIAQTPDRRMPFHLLQRFFVVGYNVFFYPFKTLLPFRLSAFYPFPLPLRTVPVEFILPTLAAAAGLFLLWRYGRRDRRIMFGCLWYLAALFPVSQVFPLAGLAVVADRYAYLPSLGLFYLAAVAGVGWWDRADGKNRSRRTVLIVILAALTVFWSALTVQRIRIWKDSRTLWENVVEKFPDQPIALMDLGLYYLDQHEYAQARSYFDQALVIKNNFPDAYNNRAIVAYALKDYQAALEDCERALATDSLFIDAYNTRGMVYNDLGEHARAEADFFKALSLNPDLPKTYNNLGNVYLAVGDYDRALAAYDRSLVLDPGFAEVYFNRGGVFYQQERYEAAIAEFDRAVRINPRYAEAYYNRGSCYFSLGDYQAALRDYNLVLELKPQLAGVYENTARVYYMMQDYSRAWQELQKALAAGYPADTGLVNLIRSRVRP